MLSYSLSYIHISHFLCTQQFPNKKYTLSKFVFRLIALSMFFFRNKKSHDDMISVIGWYGNRGNEMNTLLRMLSQNVMNIQKFYFKRISSEKDFCILKNITTTTTTTNKREWTKLLLWNLTDSSAHSLLQLHCSHTFSFPCIQAFPHLKMAFKYF